MLLTFIQSFNQFDYLLLAIIFIYFLLGFKQGLIKSILSLVVWLIAWVVALCFTKPLIDTFNFHSVNSAFVFLCIVILIWFVGFIIRFVTGLIVSPLSKTFLSRFLGAVINIVTGSMVCFLIIFIIMQTPLQQAKWFQQSQLSYLAEGWVTQFESYIYIEKK